MSTDIHQLIKEQMREAENHMRRILDDAMFKSEPGPPVAPPTRRELWRRDWRYVKNYFYTVWRALRGDDLDTPTDWDDY